MPSRSLDILIRGRDQFTGPSKRIRSSMAGLGKSLASLKGLAVGALGGYALKRVASDAVRAFGVQEQAEAKLRGTLQATGKAAGYTAEQLQKHAAALQEVTTFGDETIIGGQAILATFKNLSGEAFDRATASMLDMAATMGGANGEAADLKSVAVQLGKALNDPVKGLSALSRVGVTFTQEQKEQIRAMQQAGDMAGAQGVILRELEGEFGGVAEAMAQTTSGKLTQFSNAWGDLKELLGSKIAPILANVTDFIRAKLPAAFATLRPFVEGYVGIHTAASVAVVHWRDTLKAAMLGAQLSITTFYNDAQHFFAVNLPELLDWFGRNWQRVFIDAMTAAEVAIKNFANNAVNIIGEVWRYITSLGDEGFEGGIAATIDRLTVPLLEGFHATLEEMPNLTARAMTETERILTEKLSATQARLGEAFDEMYADRIRFLFGENTAPQVELPPVRLEPESAAVLRDYVSLEKGVSSISARFLTRAPGQSLDGYSPDAVGQATAKHLERANRRQIAIAERQARIAEEQLRVLREHEPVKVKVWK